MLILPYQTRFTAKSLPALTLALIVINVFVFFALQSRDEAVYEAAYEYYARSELPRIERKRYEAWLIDRNDSDARERLRYLRAIPAKADARPVFQLVQSDRGFLRELRARRIVRAEDPEYGAWVEARTEFDARWARAFTERFALSPAADGLWRYITHQFLHGDFGHLLGNMIVLLVAGPFAEVALGRGRFLVAYLASGAAAGGLQLLLAPVPLIGASGAISGAMAMVAVLYWTRRVPVFYWVFFYFDTARIPALALLPVWIANEIYQWSTTTGSRIAYAAHIGGFLGGALIAWLLRKRDSEHIDRVLDAEFADERRSEKHSELVRQAQQAAARLDTKRAARLYGELAELHPGNIEYMTSALNMALLGHDDEQLKDSALRVLWSRSKSRTDDLRKAFLAMGQPKVLKVLPVDEHLRLVRRMVRFRDDTPALRVLDSLLADDHLRTLYGRQIADCLLGLFTTYTRNGLRHPAENVRQRLAKYFPSPDAIGGIPPSREMPASIRGSTLRPDTLHIDLGR
ncbi:MAG TPA: rhomboid family intramembrane serine protease [Burkholderiaceae bacterium]|nr:rhomboid family intramembrane serine protease [Burkholderiaceae bacterium]